MCGRWLSSSLVLVCLAALAVTSACSGADARVRRLDRWGPANAAESGVWLARTDAGGGRLSDDADDAWARGYLTPYDSSDVISGFWDCRPGGRRHRGLDFAGVGPNAGLGTPVVSIGRAEVVAIGRPDEDPGRYGRPLRRGRTTERGGRSLPVSAELDGYGRVHFFTETYGSWRTGAIVVTVLLEGPLVGYRVRYMHLGAIRPDLTVGQVVEAGEEIGVLGGTAVQHSTPHVHVDAEDPDERRVDLAPYLGLTDTSSERRGGTCRR